jgi:hypothetical protein
MANLCLWVNETYFRIVYNMIALLLCRKHIFRDTHI